MVSNFQRGTQEFSLYNFKGFSTISSTILVIWNLIFKKKFIIIKIEENEEEKVDGRILKW